MIRGLKIGKQLLERFISVCLEAGKPKVLTAAGILLCLVATADWLVGRTISLAVLYILPALLAAVVMNPLQALIFAFVCALLKTCFDVPASRMEVALRFAFSLPAYFASGLFVIALIRNRQFAVQHLSTLRREHALRVGAEEQLREFVESSPAAILTLDSEGTVLAANRAASVLFGSTENFDLEGRDISEFLPLLSDALQLHLGPEAFKTAAQSQGRRQSGELFLAHTWFSSYISLEGPRLAAIVVDASEEMRDREEQNLAELLEHNRMAAAALSHEVRNAYSAIEVVSTNLGERFRLESDADYQALLHLVAGLEKIARLRLQTYVHEATDHVPLRSILDNLRIIVDSEWREMDGVVHWPALDGALHIAADPHGLLQALLNVAHNSYRAVQDKTSKELKITVSTSEEIVRIRLEDNGPGVASPEHLFHPFQTQADGTGLGLYISRALVRSYGGDLRFEPRDAGSCFVFELQRAE